MVIEIEVNSVRLGYTVIISQKLESLIASIWPRNQGAFLHVGARLRANDSGNL